MLDKYKTGYKNIYTHTHTQSVSCLAAETGFRGTLTGRRCWDPASSPHLWFVLEKLDTTGTWKRKCERLVQSWAQVMTRVKRINTHPSWRWYVPPRSLIERRGTSEQSWPLREKHKYRSGTVVSILPGTGWIYEFFFVRHRHKWVWS